MHRNVYMCIMCVCARACVRVTSVGYVLCKPALRRLDIIIVTSTDTPAEQHWAWKMTEDSGYHTNGCPEASFRHSALLLIIILLLLLLLQIAWRMRAICVYISESCMPTCIWFSRGCVVPSLSLRQFVNKLPAPRRCLEKAAINTSFDASEEPPPLLLPPFPLPPPSPLLTSAGTPPLLAYTAYSEHAGAFNTSSAVSLRGGNPTLYRHDEDEAAGLFAEDPD